MIGLFRIVVSVGVIALRFITGLAMAGIYPVGMKLMTTWVSCRN